MGGNFADPEVIGNEVSSIFNDLASRYHGAGDAVKPGNAGILKKFIHRLTKLPEITGPAFGADAGATDSAGVCGTGTLIDGLTHFAAFIHQNRLEGG